MVTVRSRARARNRARPTLAWFIAAIIAALIALSLRIAAAEPIAPGRAGGELADTLDALEVGGADDQPIDEAIDEAIDDRDIDDEEIDETIALDELTDDQLEELGFDDDAIARGWVTSAAAPAEMARTRSPIGRVDLSLVYRRTDPIASEARSELLILGTWRR